MQAPGKQLFFLALALILAASLAICAKLDIPPPEALYPFVPRWQGTHVLHLGDSHVSRGLREELSRSFKRAGAHYKTDMWVGSRSRSWVVTGRLARSLRHHNPDIVIVTLGTNEMPFATPEHHRPWVEKIVSHIKDRACYWIGPPPLITDETGGFNEMLERSTKPCRYFDSRLLGLKPKPGGHFHLSREQGQCWGRLVWLWLGGRYMGDWGAEEINEIDPCLSLGLSAEASASGQNSPQHNL